MTTGDHTASPQPGSTGKPPFMSVPRAATELGCSPGLLYRLVRDGDFPAVRLGAKKYLVPTRVIDEIVAVVVATGGLVDIAQWKHARDAIAEHH